MIRRPSVRLALQRLLELGDNPLGDLIGVLSLFAILFMALFAGAVLQ